MAAKGIFLTVGENVKALRKSTLTPNESRSINRFAVWTGVANGTLDRIERGVTDPQLSHLVKIVSKFQSYGLEVWHLFAPGLNPLSPPEMLTPKKREFYEAVEAAYTKLPERDTQIPRRVAHKMVKRGK